MGEIAAVYHQVGERLRQLRVSCGLTQEELARRAGLNRAYVGFIERAERRASIETVARLAAELDVELDEVFRFS